VDEVLEKHTTSLPSPTSPIREIPSSSSSLEGRKGKKKKKKKTKCDFFLILEEWMKF
jgi:hypothetical protein